MATPLALALLLGAGVGPAAAAQILLVPASEMRSVSHGQGFFDEPPCRQHRRLEPWRAHVHNQCAAEVTACGHRGMGPMELHRPPVVERTLARPVPPPQLSPLFKEVDAFFDGAFARPSDVLGSSDPFEGMMQRMLDFSLRAFDQFDEMASAAQQVTQDVEEEEEGMEEVGEASIAEPPASSESEDAFYEEDEGEEVVGEPSGFSIEDSQSVTLDMTNPTYDQDVAGEDSEEEYLDYQEHVGATPVAEAPPPQTPETAAEMVLDSAVASFARSAFAASKEGLQREIPRRLAAFGHKLVGHGRRLSEGEADPHAQVKERLGRRLSEYEIIFSPQGGMAVYTSSGFGSPFAPRLPPRGSASHAPALGMDTEEADECLRSRFDNGDLRGGCGAAVAELLDAAQDEARVMREVIVDVSPAKPCLMEFLWANANAIWAGFVFLSTLLLCVLWTEEEEEEEDVEKKHFHLSTPCEGFVSSDEFDYARLPEDESAEEKVFVGVPVQVV
ncbi:hypothetical protein ACHAXT_003217 [Thalassiosira profunda]